MSSSFSSLSRRTVKSHGNVYKQTQHRVICGTNPTGATPVDLENDNEINTKITKAQWPDVNFPKNLDQPDFRLSLPGSAGVIDVQQKEEQQAILDRSLIDRFLAGIKEDKKVRQSREAGLETSEASSDKAVSKLTQAFRFSARDATTDSEIGVWNRDETYQEVEDFVKCKDHEVLVQKCPDLLKDQLDNTFSPYFDGSNRKINTVITVAFKTDNDMSSWNDQVADERQEKLTAFTTFAKKLCYIMHEKDKFADFIDPTDGLPWFDKAFAEKRGTVSETSTGFNSLSNITIEDLGCCSVICHNKFGKNVFVGTIASECETDFWYFGYLKYITQSLEDQDATL